MQQHSWLYSDSFLKRAFAIWGHYMVANLIIGGCILAFFLLIGLVFGLNLMTVSTQQGGNALQVETNID